MSARRHRRGEAQRTRSKSFEQVYFLKARKDFLVIAVMLLPVVEPVRPNRRHDALVGRLESTSCFNENCQSLSRWCDGQWLVTKRRRHGDGDKWIGNFGDHEHCVDASAKRVKWQYCTPKTEKKRQCVRRMCESNRGMLWSYAMRLGCQTR